MNNFRQVNRMYPYRVQQNDRIIGGGFFGPFLLGGITGGLLAPAFYPRPYYQPYPVYQQYYGYQQYPYGY
jgi:hypothetical protein